MELFIKRYHLHLVILFIISVMPLLSLFTPGFPVTHDGQDHIARIANFYQSLSEGVLIPRWAANLNWGYGHPILMFLYPLPSYIGSLFRFIGFTFVDATKLVFAVSFVLSIFSMYLFVKEAWGTKAGLIAGIFYGFAPYRFIDLYVRGAIGEHVAFIFPPLILYFLLKLSRMDFLKKKSGLLPYTLYLMPYTLLTSIALALLILSHNAISLMFLPIILAYMVYLYIYEADRQLSFLVSCFLCFAFAFGLSAFFWMPAFLEGKYTLRDIVTAGSFDGRFVPFSWFIYSPWNYGQGNDFTKMIGIPQLLGVIFGLWAIVSQKIERKTILVSCFLFLVLSVSIFLMTSGSSLIWQKIILLQKFQFPWRFLTVTTFAGAILGAIGISNVSIMIEKLFAQKKYFGLLLFPASATFYVVSCFLCIVLTVQMWYPKEYRVKPESFFTGVYDSTTDTGESSPIWSTRFMEHRYSSPLESITGNISIQNQKRSTTKHEYVVSSEKGGRLLENTLYFPGWNVYIDGKTVEVQYQDPEYRGLMTFIVPAGEHHIIVQFGETKLRTIANSISMISIGIIIVCITYVLLRKKVFFN